MKAIAVKQLAVGMKALLQVGSPVRQWMHAHPGSKRKWLIPVRYTPLSLMEAAVGEESLYAQVSVGKVMLPYAIVYHHDGHGWVKLWLDTREVVLFAVDDC